jgi:predicted enzyme related to lactoylglutathione lyase
MTDAILGRPLWYELLTNDVKAAEAFYTKVIGWSVQPFRPEPDAYDMWMRTAEAPVGGVMKIPAGMNFPPHWEMYVGVPKLEDAVSKIERLGGKALSPVIEIPNVGRMRTVHDPQGVVFCVYEPSDTPQPEAEPAAGDASWHELLTTDAEAAVKFYGDVFGWKVTREMDMGPMGKYYLFGRGGNRELGGMMNKAPEMAQVPSHWGIYFMVDSVHDAAGRVTANGGRVINGPMEVPGGDFIINCIDPQGAAFSLHSRKR